MVEERRCPRQLRRFRAATRRFIHRPSDDQEGGSRPRSDSCREDNSTLNSHACSLATASRASYTHPRLHKHPYTPPEQNFTRLRATFADPLLRLPLVLVPSPSTACPPKTQRSRRTRYARLSSHPLRARRRLVSGPRGAGADDADDRFLPLLRPSTTSHCLPLPPFDYLPSPHRFLRPFPPPRPTSPPPLLLFLSTSTYRPSDSRTRTSRPRFSRRFRSSSRSRTRRVSTRR